MTSSSVSAVVVAQNEERHIAACLASLSWADELLLFDGGSVDRTVEIAAAVGARVVHRAFDNFSAQRMAALGAATSDWVLFVDADERVSAGLAREIRSALNRDVVGYWIPRRNYIWGRWIRGGGWWPDKQLRLLRRGKASYDVGRPVHELAELDGPSGELRCSLVHYNYDTVGQFGRKQRRYAALEASRLRQQGERWRPKRILSAPAREAWRRFVSLRGHRDGPTGAALAALTALSAAETQLLLAAETVD